MYQTTVGVGGMMCEMCELHIQDKVRKDFSPRKVKANRHRKQVVMLTDEPLDEQAMRASIEDTGYEYLGMECKPVEQRRKGGLFHRR